jgi:hypothetical protein
MRAPRLEVAEVIRRYQDDYHGAHSSSPDQRRVLRDLVACRTALLGGHLRRCDACGHEEIAYNSCRNRHCPKCQARRQAAWLEAQSENLLEVPYFHVVFTLPEELGPLALQNKRILYGLLFRSAAETLLAIARDERRLGARIGFTAVLHTWGQTLLHHPHVHCLVPGGGLSVDGASPTDGRRWIHARERFFLPVRVLSRLFRGKYLAYLREAYDRGELLFAGELQRLACPHAWHVFLKPLRNVEWVVYAKPPFGSPELVLKYLARYTHRVAISNHRLLTAEDGHVAFRYKDYRRGRTDRVLRLAAVEFIRRFLLHVLPKGFVRIRHYGLLANRARKENLRLCRRLIATTPEAADDAAPPNEPDTTVSPAPCDDHCPACKKGHLLFVALVPPSRAGPHAPINTPAYA